MPYYATASTACFCTSGFFTVLQVKFLSKSALQLHQATTAIFAKIKSKLATSAGLNVICCVIIVINRPFQCNIQAGKKQSYTVLLLSFIFLLPLQAENIAKRLA